MKWLGRLENAIGGCFPVLVFFVVMLISMLAFAPVLW